MIRKIILIVTKNIYVGTLLIDLGSFGDLSIHSHSLIQVLNNYLPSLFYYILLGSKNIMKGMIFEAERLEMKASCQLLPHI